MKQVKKYMHAGQEIAEPVMEQQTGSKLRKEYIKALYYYTCLFNLHAEYLTWNAGLDEA